MRGKTARTSRFAAAKLSNGRETGQRGDGSGEISAGWETHKEGDGCVYVRPH
jgi:hypothetical protein